MLSPCHGQGVISSLGAGALLALSTACAQLQSHFPPQWNDPAEQRGKSFEQGSVVPWVEQLPGTWG